MFKLICTLYTEFNMGMNQQLLFFFSAIGAFNGLLVGLYFVFFIKPKNLSNKLLGALFLALSVRVGKSVFLYFYDTIADVYIQFGLFACWLIGPLLFYYVRSAVTPKSTLVKEATLLILLLSIIGIAINVLFSWSAYHNLWNYFIKVIYLQWLGFVVITGWILHKYRNKWFINSKNKPFRLWLASIYFGNLIICLAFNTGNYTSYIVGALSFSFVFYALILLLTFHKRRDELLFLKTKKYKSNQLNAKDAKELGTQLEDILKKERLFLDANLSLDQVAKLLNVHRGKISQALNEYLHTNFNDFVNAYRIQEAKAMVHNKRDYTFEAIAMDCGFNSKSTFYAAFKKHTGMTPSKFRDQVLKA
ncbi:helix-turn-helix domain-containing protein [Croceitalea rosinachiae]|uniref:Helix-turn-helix domain-containing protein n=1 Tax=Croceitalea rosinachiae TaxID=3075596 RepID=A0ABU3AC78_9FLAO|nr:helix-turn-helix domain-containing protein [Croceitalea sp. F388]MDT0607781.1 helix-turn-helix domain-containing protein [Croceitalea sp. F388]